MIIRRLGLVATIMLLAQTSFADTLQLKNGVQISGYFEGGSSRFVRFRTDSGVQDYDILTVRSVRITGVAEEAPEPPRSARRDSRQDSYSFGPDQERIIRAWFSSHYDRRNLPPGLAKRESLPPGLERQLQRNGTLPPGLQKRMEPLPIALEQQLPILSIGIRRVVISGNVVLMEEATSRILDLIRGVY